MIGMDTTFLQYTFAAVVTFAEQKDKSAVPEDPTQKQQRNTTFAKQVFSSRSDQLNTLYRQFAEQGFQVAVCTPGTAPRDGVGQAQSETVVLVLGRHRPPTDETTVSEMDVYRSTRNIDRDRRTTNSDWICLHATFLRAALLDAWKMGHVADFVDDDDEDPTQGQAHSETIDWAEADKECDDSAGLYHLDTEITEGVRVKIFPIKDELWNNNFLHKYSYISQALSRANKLQHAVEESADLAVQATKSIVKTGANVIQKPQGVLDIHSHGSSLTKGAQGLANGVKGVTGMFGNTGLAGLGAATENSQQLLKNSKMLLSCLNIDVIDPYLMKDYAFLERIRSHYGDGVGLYFAFLGSLSLMLAPVALLGFFVWVLVVMVLDLHDTYLVCLAIYALLLTWMWAPFFAIQWERKRDILVRHWGISGCYFDDVEKSRTWVNKRQTPSKNKKSFGYKLWGQLLNIYVDWLYPLGLWVLQFATIVALATTSFVLFAVFIYFFIATEHQKSCGECCCAIDELHTMDLPQRILDAGPHDSVAQGWLISHRNITDLHLVLNARCNANVTSLVERVTSVQLQTLRRTWEGRANGTRCDSMAKAMGLDDKWSKWGATEVFKWTNCNPLYPCFTDVVPAVWPPNFKFMFITAQDIVLAVFIAVLTVIFYQVGELFAYLQNHERQAQRDNSLISKTFIMVWISQFAWPLIIALVFLPFGTQVRNLLASTGIGLFSEGSILSFEGEMLPGVITLDTMMVGPLVIGQMVSLVMDTYLLFFILRALGAVMSAPGSCLRCLKGLFCQGNAVGVGTRDSQTLEARLAETQPDCRLLDKYNQLYTPGSVDSFRESDTVSAPAPSPRSTGDGYQGVQEQEAESEVDSLAGRGKGGALDSESGELDWVKAWKKNRHDKNAKSLLIAEGEMDRIELIEDMIDACNCFQFVTMITVGWALTPLLILLNNMCELHFDVTRILTKNRRSVPSYYIEFDTYNSIIKITIMLGAALTSAMIALSTGELEAVIRLLWPGACPLRAELVGVMAPDTLECPELSQQGGGTSARWLVALFLEHVGMCVIAWMFVRNDAGAVEAANAKLINSLCEADKEMLKESSEKQEDVEEDDTERGNL